MGIVIGPGSLNVDITGVAPRLPVEGETAKGTQIRFGPGGKGNNQMTAAHRAGAEAWLIGRRGEDLLGRLIREHCEKEGLDPRYITVDPNASTGGALIEVDQNTAQNRILVIAGANGMVGRKQVYACEEGFAQADVVLTQFETTMEAVLAAKELAVRYSKPFILNPAPYVSCPDELYRGIDYLTPNETETWQLTGQKVETLSDCRLAAGRLFEKGIRHVIITLGSHGAYYADADRELSIPALHVKAVDTTGAGDAFNGGLAAALSESMPIEKALHFATCTSAISVSRPGAAPSMPVRREIDGLMKQEFPQDM